MKYLNGGWSYNWQGDFSETFAAEKQTILEALQSKIGKENVLYTPGVDFANFDEAEIAKAVEIVEATGNEFEIVSSDLAPWHPGRCAEIKVGGKPVAHAGELHPRVIAALNLPERTCAFAAILSELPLAKVSAAPKIWNLPATVQDVALVVTNSVSAIAVENALKAGAGDL